MEKRYRNKIIIIIIILMWCVLGNVAWRSPSFSMSDHSRCPPSHDRLDWPRLSYREQFKEGDEGADRGNDGKTTPKSGLALNGIYYYGGVEEAGCKIYSGAPAVSLTKG